MNAGDRANIVLQDDFRESFHGKADGSRGHCRGTDEHSFSKEPEREINLMDAIENRSTLQGIRTVADFIIMIRLPRREKRSRVDSRRKHIADAPLTENFFDLRGTRMEAHIAGDHGSEISLLHFLLQSLDVLESVGERLLDEEVATHLRSYKCLLHMHNRGRADEHNRRFECRERLLKIRKTLCPHLIL